MTRLFTHNNNGDVAITDSGTVVVDTALKWEGADCCRFDSAGAYRERTQLTTTGQVQFTRCYIYLAAYPDAAQYVLNEINTAAAIVWRLQLSTTGTLRLVDSGGSFVGGATSALTLGFWHILEVKWKQDVSVSANGSMAMKLDGLQVVTDTTAPLLTVAANRLRWGRPISTAGFTTGPRFDAVVQNNDQGAAPDNTYPGGLVPPGPVTELRNMNAKRRAVNPVGISQVNNVQLRAANDRYALRFVADSSFTLQRFIMGFNTEGVYTDGSNVAAPTEIRTQTSNKQTVNASYPATPAGLPGGWTVGTGRIGYAHGNGGTIRAQLCTCNADGTPNLSGVLATDTFNAVDRYVASKTYFGYVAGGPNPFYYLDFGGIALTADTMYAVVISNTHADPLNNYCSVNCPTTSLGAGGPHRVNTTNKYTAGALAGLDARESSWWSIDAGTNWSQGEKVGGDTIASGQAIDRPGGHIFAYYSGLEVTADEAVRLPWYGYELPAGASTREGIQPYYNYLSSQATPTLVNANAGRAVTLTEAGGFAPSGSNVGVVTVTNVNTGVSGTTASLGSGLVKGVLTPPVPVAPGETYTLTCTGTVFRCESDVPLVTVFNLGAGDFPHNTTGQGADRAELFALPHPYFAAVSVPVRNFDGANDYVHTNIGGCNLTGAFSLAVVFRLNAVGVWHALIGNHDFPGGNSQLSIEVSSTNHLNLGVGATDAPMAATLVANRWYIGVFRKASGSAAVKASLYDFTTGTWTHETLGTVANAATQAGGTVRFGEWQGVDDLNGRLALAAEWGTELTDPQVLALETGRRTANWSSVGTFGPVGTWEFNQGSTSTAVTDLTGNGAAQSAVQGTSVVVDDLPWTFTTEPLVVAPTAILVRVGGSFVPAVIRTRVSGTFVEKPVVRL